MAGAQLQLERLIALRSAAKNGLLERLEVNCHSAGGAHHSRSRGRGIEFDSLRPYQAGDDLRTIDWRITARTQKPFTRLFHSEREQPLLFWIDQRPTLQFGSRHAFKAVQAAEAAALIGWSALAQGDRIGAIVSNGQQRYAHKAKRGQRALLELLHQQVICNLAPQPSQITPISDDLTELQRLSFPGSTLVLASDFQTLDEPALELLHQLGRRYTLITLVIYDPLECTPPPAGRYWFEQNGTPQLLDTRTRSQQNQYVQQASARQQQLTEQLNRCRARVHWITTARPVEEQLHHLEGAHIGS